MAENPDIGAPNRNWKWDPNLQVYVTDNGNFVKLRAGDGKLFYSVPNSPQSPNFFSGDGDPWDNNSAQMPPPQDVQYWDIARGEPLTPALDENGNPLNPPAGRPPEEPEHEYYTDPETGEVIDLGPRTGPGERKETTPTGGRPGKGKIPEWLKKIFWPFGGGTSAGSNAAVAVTAAGAGAELYQSYKAGQAEKAAGTAANRAAKKQADLLDYNAAVADVQSRDARVRGAEDEANYRKQIEQVISTQRVGYAAGNVDVGYGSPVDVQADSAFLGELDALTIKTNAQREAWGYQVEAYDYRQRAKITREEGVYAEASGAQRAHQQNIGTATSLLQTGAGLLMSRYGFRG